LTLDVSFGARQISHCSDLFDLNAFPDGLNIAFVYTTDDRPKIWVIHQKETYRK
jgi:hypothetical protein